MAEPVPLLDRLRNRGWRVTAQRRPVAQVLEGEHVHLTAEDVHRRAREVVPELSLATVYNTINELVAMGEVIEVRATPGPSRYDPNVAPEHHHLDLHRVRQALRRSRSRRPFTLPESERRGFQLDIIAVTFRGRCPTCVTG